MQLRRGLVHGGVSGLDEFVVPLRCALLAQFATVIGMLSHGCRNLLDDRAEVLASDENYDGCSRVSPSEISQNLIDSVRQRLGAVPDFAFAGEEIAVLLPNQDIGLSRHVEGLAGGATHKLGIERR